MATRHIQVSRLGLEPTQIRNTRVYGIKHILIKRRYRVKSKLQLFQIYNCNYGGVRRGGGVYETRPCQAGLEEDSNPHSADNGNENNVYKNLHGKKYNSLKKKKNEKY